MGLESPERAVQDPILHGESGRNTTFHSDDDSADLHIAKEERTWRG